MDITYLPASAVSCWMPFTTSPFFVEDYFGNMQLYPFVVPVTAQLKLLDQAILRAQLRQAVLQAKHPKPDDRTLTIDHLVSVDSGGIMLGDTLLKGAVHPAEAVLIVLDGLEPASTVISHQTPKGVSVLCQALCFEQFSLNNMPKSITITFADTKTVKVPLVPDMIQWLAAPAGTVAMVQYETDQTSSDIHQPVVFGEVGIVLDTRGRPFVEPTDTPTDKARLQQWLSAFTRPIDVINLARAGVEA